MADIGALSRWITIDAIDRALRPALDARGHRQQLRVDLETAAVRGNQRDLESQIAVDFDEVDDPAAIESEFVVGDHENRPLDCLGAQRARARKRVGANVKNLYAVEFLRAW